METPQLIECVKTAGARYVRRLALSVGIVVASACVATSLAVHAVAGARSLDVSVRMVVALLAGAGVLLVTLIPGLLLGQRLAFAAGLRALLDAEGFVTWVVARFLERATGDDRRGTRALGTVVRGLGKEHLVSGVARFALERFQLGAVGAVAVALARAKADQRPIHENVRAALEQSTRETLTEARWMFGGVLGGIVLSCAAADLWVRIA